jgi:hypothetical protein
MYKIIFTTVILTILSCSAQVPKKDTLTSKKSTMEYLDFKKYEKLDYDGNFYIVGTKRIRIIFNEKEYMGAKTYVIETNTDSPYGVYKAYRKNNSLKSSGRTFYGFYIEKGKEYNDIGELVKVTDYDKPYKLSLEDLAKKIKEDHDVDLFSLKQVFELERQESLGDIKIPLYFFYYRDKINPSKLYANVIDATTGKTLFSDITYEEGGTLNLYKEFAKDYKAKEAKKTAPYRTKDGKTYTKEEWDAYENQFHKEYNKDKGKGMSAFYEGNDTTGGTNGGGGSSFFTKETGLIVLALAALFFVMYFFTSVLPTLNP